MWIPYVICAAALLVALRAYARASAALRAAEDASRAASRSAEAVRVDLEQRIDILQRLLAKVASGDNLTIEMIEDGQLWKDVEGAEAQRLMEEAGANAFILDVRTPDETAAGIVEGAVLIPMDEIEERRAELPTDGRPVLVYCAMGGRSAAVCDHLAKDGVQGLHNLVGGFGAWPGSTSKP